MQTVAIPGVGRASRIALGTATLPSLDEPERVWDAFVDAGGSTFDAAWHYGEENERRLGAWIEARGVRDRIVVVGKGAHTPHCRPEHVAPQLEASLDRLRTDRVDVYLLHRDDEEVPIAEWAEALAAEVSRGRARALGVSNWTLERAHALAREASRRGLPAPAVLSNQLSLARAVEPVWAGCRDARDNATQAWLSHTGTILLAWSAAARGWFGGREPDGETARCWRTPANEERRRRVEVLARELGVAPAAVALAWVLTQPFATVAVCAPRSLADLEHALAADEITLDAGAAAWLDLGVASRPR